MVSIIHFLTVLLLFIYCRPIKFPGAAHFSLRCGCSNTTQNFNNASIPTQNNVIREKEQYQLPIVALSFNFVSKSSSGARNTLLSLGDIETLHHEWGHALHSLLSRTTFQHLSGTRGATDFIEVCRLYNAM
jgi:mitochondrial intermediate peptidase